LDSGCDRFGSLCKLNQLQVQVDGGVVQWDRRLEDVLVEMTSTPAATRLKRHNHLQQRVAVKDGRQETRFGRGRDGCPIEDMVNDRVIADVGAR